MTEYIDKKEVIDFLMQTRKQMLDEGYKHIDFYKMYDALLHFQQRISLQSTKVKEVKQGFWVLETEPDGKPYCYHCSVCDTDFHYIGITEASDYCPNCGAEMINTTGIKAINRADNKEAFNITKQSLAKIIDAMKKYADKHELAMDCGSEYIMQNDEAQIDALDLVCKIFDTLSDDNKETE